MVSCASGKNFFPCKTGGGPDLIFRSEQENSLLVRACVGSQLHSAKIWGDALSDACDGAGKPNLVVNGWGGLYWGTSKVINCPPLGVAPFAGNFLCRLGRKQDLPNSSPRSSKKRGRVGNKVQVLTVQAGAQSFLPLTIGVPAPPLSSNLGD